MIDSNTTIEQLKETLDYASEEKELSLYKRYFLTYLS